MSRPDAEPPSGTPLQVKQRGNNEVLAIPKPLLAIDDDRNKVKIDTEEFPITFGDVFENDRYKIHTFAVEGEQADGCIYEIASNEATAVMRIVDEEVKRKEIAIKGSGWFLGIKPTGELFVHEVGVDMAENPLVLQERGSIGAWIAGKNGLEVLDVTTPPYNTSMEMVVDKEDSTIPNWFVFWTGYNRRKDLGTATDLTSEVGITSAGNLETRALLQDTC